MRAAAKFALWMLLIGFVVNVIVTVVLTATIDKMLRPESGMSMHDDVHWSVGVTPYVGTDVVEWQENAQSRGMSADPAKMVPAWVERPAPTKSEFGDRKLHGLKFRATGFPWRSSWCQIREWTLDKDDSHLETGVQGGAVLPFPNWTSYIRGWSEPRVLPLRPIWSGLVLNTLAYAILAAALVSWIVSLRRLRPFTRGACPRCRTPMLGDYTSTCPTCSWTFGTPRRSLSLGRAIKFALTALAIGFVFNAVVSLVLCATVNVITGPANNTSEQDGILWRVGDYPYFGSNCYEWRASRGGDRPYGTPAWLLPSWITRPPPTKLDLEGLEERQVYYLSTGLPWRSSWCEVSDTTLDTAQARVSSGPRGGIELPMTYWRNNWYQLQAHVVPLRPLWDGLALNMSFYALIAACVVSFVAARRRLRRFRRGKCPCCGYEMHCDYSNACPECGWKISSA